MLIEQILFTVIAFVFFVFMFFKLFKENDTNYIVILILQAVGIALNFVEVLITIKLNIFAMVVKYILGIGLPILIFYLEKRGIPLIRIANIFKAKLYLKKGDTKKAKQQLINLSNRYPNIYSAHQMLAEIYETEGGMRKAIDEYVKAIDINKRDYASYFRVAELLTDFDKKDEATQMLYSLLNKKPQYEKATNLLGDLLIEKGEYKEAANIYQNALKYDPTNYELNYNLGIAYTMLNDFQNAKLYYERAAEFNSMLYNSKYSLAEIALIYKELEEAEKYFMQVIDDEELSADAYYELAKISMIKLDKETAITYANTAINLNTAKIVPKIKNDIIFIPILARLSVPFNIEENENEKTKLSKKEQKAKKHLEEMFEITRNLSYDDIDLLKKDTLKKEELEKEKEEKEFDEEKEKYK